MPLEDKSGKLFTGQGERGFLEFLTEDERKAFPVIIDRKTTVLISDGKVLDMDDPIDEANWRWIQKHPYISLNRMAGMASRDAVYYIDNPEQEAEERVTKDKIITTAKSKIYQASNAKKTALAKALGNPGANSMSIGRVEDWLANYAIKTPETIISLLDPKATARVTAMTLFQDLQRARIITRHGGEWRYGGIDGAHMGQTDEVAIEYIMDKGNEEQVFVMSNILKEKTGQ
jgi:hypothetical protein